MNFTRIILDGFAMTLVFNMMVGMFWFIMPHAYSVMLPKEIQKCAGEVSKKEKLRLAAWLYPLYIGIVVWITVSLGCSGTTGFWNLFWSAYIEWMFINFGDFIILDCLLRGHVKDKGLIPGTENCKAWQAREWMKSAVPEHFLGWTFLLCPIASAITAFVFG